MRNTLSCTGGREAIYVQDDLPRIRDKSVQTTTTMTGSQLVQTECTTTETSIQTALTFVEKLTHNNTQEVGSSEEFDVKCEICEVGNEKLALGFCRTCRQYMCLQCCKIHETLSTTTKHAMIGKADFLKVMKQKSLFDQKLVPVQQCSFKYEGSVCKVGAFNVPNCEDIHFWTPLKSGICTMITINHQSGDPLSKTISLSDKTTDDLCENSDPKCKKRAYFVISKDVYLDKVSPNSRSVVYMYCPEHSDITVKIAFEFVGNCPQDILFVSDYGLKSVIALDKHSQTLFMFSLDKWKLCPLGITCDEENNVYVSCKNQVIQINRDGMEGHSILQSSDRTADGPREIVDVCYNPLSKKLAVAEICYSTSSKKQKTEDNSKPLATLFKFLP